MNKDKAKRIIEIGNEIIKLQQELKEFGVTFTFNQSLSDAVSFCQGYLLAKDEETKTPEVVNVETVKEQ